VKIHTQQQAPEYEELGLFAIDQRPAAVGPYTVPLVNFDDAATDTRNIHIVACGGQATIPIVRAIYRVADVKYAEMILTGAAFGAAERIATQPAASSPIGGVGED
jgi:acetaldehyde dehydrogenase